MSTIVKGAIKELNIMETLKVLMINIIMLAKITMPIKRKEILKVHHNIRMAIEVKKILYIKKFSNYIIYKLLFWSSGFKSNVPEIVWTDIHTHRHYTFHVIGF